MNLSSETSAQVRSQAIVFLVITSLLWSSGGVLIKLVEWNAPAIAGMRSAIAACFLFLFYRRLRFRLTPWRVGAAFAYMATVMLFVIANKLTTAANAILLQYTAPIHVALFGSWFLGERTTRLDWLTVGVVLGGMALFFLDSLSTANMLGNAVAIASGVSFAWFALFMRKQAMEEQNSKEQSSKEQNSDTKQNSKEHNVILASALEPILLGNLVTALFGLPFMIAGDMPSAQSWLGLGLLGVLQLGLSYMLYAQAIRSVSALEAILIPVIEPLLNPVWVLLLTGERPGVWAFVGGAVVLGAITLRSVVVMMRTQRE